MAYKAYKKRNVWAERAKILTPKTDLIVDSLLKIARMIGFFAFIKIDEIWCSLVRPDSRPGMRK